MSAESTPTLDDFLSPSSTDPGAPTEGPGKAEAVEAPVAPVESRFVTSVTPAGIEVLYQWEPKRLYRLRETESPHVEDGLTEWREVPSVTTILRVLDKSGALTWWGMKVGVQAVITLFERGIVRSARYDDDQVRLSVVTGPAVVPATVENLVDRKDEEPGLLTKECLTVNHVRDEAGDRGHTVHKAFENWSEHGTVPQPAIYPEHERGYVEGLLAFLRESGVEPEATEIMVGSLVHGFAGRYDLRGRLPKDVDLVFHRTPKKGEQRDTFSAGTYLLDLKTSKDFYETHFLQLEGYELASVECGYAPTEHRMVIVVATDGTYKVERSKATGDDFLAIKGAYDALESLKKRRAKRPKKEAA